jgi:AcrR family transcriptional regulator
VTATKKQHLRYVRNGSEQAKNAAATRDNRIRDALEMGLSIREVAAAAGLSPARVHQIRHGK